MTYAKARRPPVCHRGGWPPRQGRGDRRPTLAHPRKSAGRARCRHPRHRSPATACGRPGPLAASLGSIDVCSAPPPTRSIASEVRASSASLGSIDVCSACGLQHAQSPRKPEQARLHSAQSARVRLRLQHAQSPQPRPRAALAFGSIACARPRLQHAQSPRKLEQARLHSAQSRVSLR